MSSPVPPPPTEPPQGPPPTAPPPAGQPPMMGDPTQMVNGPAIGLMVTAGIGAFFAVIGFFSNLFGAGMSTMGGLEDIEGAEWLAPFMGGAFGMAMNVISIVIAAFIIYAAMQMRQLKTWGMAVAASIVAIFPCTSPCCIVGIPIGIWALVILFKPEVKAAFS